MKDTTVILISGKKQSGKNTFGDMLYQELSSYGMAMTTSFADALKTYCRNGFPDVFKYLNNPILDNIISSAVQNADDDAIEWLSGLKCPDGCFGDKKTAMSRLLLQNVGTNLFRNQVNQDYWVNIVLDKVLACDCKYCIITDARFPNEISAFCGFPTHVIRISRPNLQLEDSHSSENSLGDIKCNYIVENNSDLDALKQRAKEIAAFIRPLNINKDRYAEDFEKFKRHNAKQIEKARREGENIRNASQTLAEVRDGLIETCKSNSDFASNAHTLDAFKLVLDYLDTINY